MTVYRFIRFADQRCRDGERSIDLGSIRWAAAPPGLTWLSLPTIARYWSAETGQNADEIERELEAWFANYVERNSAKQGAPSVSTADTTDLLVGQVAGPYLKREILDAYCEETGQPRPQFWFAESPKDPESVSPRRPQPPSGKSDEAPDSDQVEPGMPAPEFSVPEDDKHWLVVAPTELAPVLDQPQTVDPAVQDPATDSRDVYDRAEEAWPASPAPMFRHRGAAIRVIIGSALALAVLAFIVMLSPEAQRAARLELADAQRQIAELSTALRGSEEDKKRPEAELSVGRAEDASKLSASKRASTPTDEAAGKIARDSGSVGTARPLNRIVLLIQDRLNRLGYANPSLLKLDGLLGPRTSEAITVYQRKNGLKIDGQASRDLLHHIEGREMNPAQIVESKQPLRGDVAKNSLQRKFRVQLGAFRSSETASRHWQMLESRHSDLLGRLGHLITSVDFASKGKLSYVYAGPLPTLSSAKSLCSMLIERKVDCLAVQF